MLKFALFLWVRNETDIRRRLNRPVIERKSKFQGTVNLSLLETNTIIMKFSDL